MKKLLYTVLFLVAFITAKGQSEEISFIKDGVNPDYVWANKTMPKSLELGASNDQGVFKFENDYVHQIGIPNSENKVVAQIISEGRNIIFASINRDLNVRGTSQPQPKSNKKDETRILSNDKGEVIKVSRDLDIQQNSKALNKPSYDTLGVYSIDTKEIKDASGKVVAYVEKGITNKIIDTQGNTYLNIENIDETESIFFFLHYYLPNEVLRNQIKSDYSRYK